MMQDGFCGNCGASRPPQATACPQCGLPFEASSVDLTRDSAALQAPTQAAATPPQSLWQPSAPTQHAGMPNRPASRWTTRLLIGQGFVIVGLLAALLVVLLHPSSPAGVTALTPATSTPSPLPTPTPTPTAATGLASPDRTTFAQALGEALQRGDTTSILPAVETTQFIISCDSTVNSTGAGCYTSRNDLQGQIATGGLVIDLLTQGLDLVNGTASLGEYCPGPVGIGGSFLLIGTFGRDQPYPNNGQAILVISSTGPGSVTTWVWSAVFFC